ncbi:hypothetical protein KR074_009668 [Drosophila pseudoananassae]|nr:hypothetical protein KR074_009668 [Drosophila pseudoananassae]
MSPRWNQNNTPNRKRGVAARSRAIRRRPLFQGVLGVRAQRNGQLYTIREIQILGRDISANHNEEMPELAVLATRTLAEDEPQIYIDVMAGGDVELRDEEFFYMQPVLFLRDDFDLGLQEVECESSSDEDPHNSSDGDGDSNDEADADADANEEECEDGTEGDTEGDAEGDTEGDAEGDTEEEDSEDQPTE